MPSYVDISDNFILGLTRVQFIDYLQCFMGIFFISSETVFKIFAFSIFDGIVRQYISRSLIIRLVFSSLRSLFQEVSFTHFAY